MNGVFELIYIFLAYLAIMIIFVALRSIQKDIDEIYGRVYNLCITAEMILTRVSKPGPEANAVAEAYEQGKKDAWMWTPTSESRPPIGKQVLTTTRSGEEVAAFLTRDENGGYLWNGNGTPYFFEYMVAWQKLPEPYKGEKCNEGMES